MEEQPGADRCGKHPTELLTGICSSCLMERLSSVRDPGNADQCEIVELGPAEAGADADPSKLRKTLMLLFQLDDSGGGSHRPSEGQDPRVGHFEVGKGGGGGGERAAKWKGGSWLRSILRWRRNGGAGKGASPPRPPQERSVVPAGGGGEARAERKPSFRRSCEWMVCREPSRGSADLPRHSWDGSMVSRAFACSFTCLEEPPDAARRVRRSNAEEDVEEDSGGVVESRANGGHSVDVAGEGRHFRGRSCDGSGGGRRRSNRWSKVWDRSITSPLKEFVRKGEHVLERSLSESRKDSQRGRKGEPADIDEVRSGHNGYSSGRASHGVNRSSHAAANGDAHNFRPDWLRNKECKIGRSRSVHYTSPGNFDNGMLRFYLTPMRSSRSTGRGRRRNSRLFPRGIFSFI